VIRISWTPNCECGCTDEANNNSKYVIAPAVDMPLRWTILPQKQENLRLIFYHGYCQAYRTFQKNPELQQMFSINSFQNNVGSNMSKEEDSKEDESTATTRRIPVASVVDLTDTSDATSMLSVNPMFDPNNQETAAAREKTTEELLKVLCNHKISEANDRFWEEVLHNHESIACYLDEEVAHSNQQWSGCGCIGYFCIFLRIFCCCCPIVCCVQSCIREKKRDMHKTKIQ